MRIIVNGAMGRMGKMVLQAAEEMGGFEVVGLVEGSSNPAVGQTVTTRWGDLTLLDDPRATPPADGAIDFSLPGGAVGFIKAMAERGIAVVSGTTGLSTGDLAAIAPCGETAPTLWCANTSIGVFCLTDLTLRARAILGDSYDVEIVEAHHRHKRDAPSGTALAIGEKLAGTGLTPETGRSGDTGPRRAGTLGIQAVRGGEVAGEHTVYFFGDYDRIEITHRATSRMVFARGALALLRRLATMENGLYRVEDVLKFE